MVADLEERMSSVFLNYSRGSKLHYTFWSVLQNIRKIQCLHIIGCKIIFNLILCCVLVRLKLDGFIFSVPRNTNDRQGI